MRLSVSYATTPSPPHANTASRLPCRSGEEWRQALLDAGISRGGGASRCRCRLPHALPPYTHTRSDPRLALMATAAR